MRPNKSDLKTILDLFATFTNAKEVLISFPASYPRSLDNDALRLYAWDIMDIMEGISPPARRSSYLENLEWEGIETDLKRSTAYRAIDKLNKITQFGRQKMPERKYDNLGQAMALF